MVLDGLLVVAHGAVCVPDVPEGPTHPGPVVQLSEHKQFYAIH